MALPQIKIGEGLISNSLLASVEVLQELNQHWWCTIVCRQTMDDRLAVEGLLGTSVEIKTIDEEGAEHIHFSGIMYDVRLVYEIWGSYTAHLVAVSNSYLLGITARKQYYADQTLSSIASTIAGRAGLSIDVNAAGSKALNYVQYGETDFSFLNRIVDDYDAWLRPKQGGVEIFNSFQSGSTLEWSMEGGLVEFSLQGRLAPPAFGGAHYDHHAMQSNTFEKISLPAQFYDGGQHLSSAVQAASQSLPQGFEPQRARAMTLADYQAQLQAESQRSIGSAITGTGQSRNQNLMAGDTVTVSGVLDAKGTYGLVKVVHNWTPQGYINHFVCTPWKNYRNPHAPAARVWSGIVSACVVDHNDPKKMGRIKVQFFWQDDGNTHWARTTAPHAGPERGFMFMPEVGDEVAVAFEDGDPERPVILGSMWNGVFTAPRSGFWGEEDIADNNIKRIVTKAGNRLQLVDKPGQESVVLGTPHELRISMIEKTNEHGRSTIVLHSENGDILLNAPNGQIHIRSKFFTKETN
jgi:type VI secretion system secreted protein VgrG